MKICAYVQENYSKANYKNECMDTRQFVGLRVILDCLEQAGYQVEYAGVATVHEYDIVLVSLTADCDWWSYIRERLRWRKGNYKVLIGGAGVLHIAPFTPWFYAAMFGRGENLIVPLVDGIKTGNRYEHESICYSDNFNQNGIYMIAQVDHPYCRQIKLSDTCNFAEGAIGCNHKCLFCGYTWHRKFASPYAHYRMEDNLFGGIADKERAMLDLKENPDSIDWAHLRTTAIDGFSERLRVGVGKPITKEIIHGFLVEMLKYSGAAHQIKFYNICGYPTESQDDWQEFVEELRMADATAPPRDKQWSIVLHSTPFRAMPATPMACAPMSKLNYRGLIGRTLGRGLKGNIIYQGRSLWSVESMGTESLSTVMLSAIAHRGAVDDCDNIAKLCYSNKFWRASAPIKEATLCKYFDMDKLFGRFTPDTLPCRYLRTYAEVEKMWGRTPLELRKGEEYAGTETAHGSDCGQGKKTSEPHGGGRAPEA